MDLRRQINKWTREIHEQEKNFEKINEMTPLLVYKEGQSFGEIALANNKPRGGTIVTLTDCHYAIVTKDAYEKLIKKDVLIKQE